MSVDSARQLCTMFLSLHVVFLSVAIVDSSAANASQEDCVRSRGVGYRGAQQSSSSGLSCLNWTNTTRDYDLNLQPDSQTGVGDHSYCRNPDSSEGPWCYISGPDGSVQRQFCTIQTCQDNAATLRGGAAESLNATGSPGSSTGGGIQTTKMAAPPQGRARPVMGISQRVHTGPKKKKDLGTLGYVIGILMMAIIIVLGVGITLGYFYKRGRDVKKQREQRAYEREMQRINLPLSAFSNPSCELVDENTIVITAQRDPSPDQEGGDPLMGQHQAGTPGA